MVIPYQRIFKQFNRGRYFYSRLLLLLSSVLVVLLLGNFFLWPLIDKWQVYHRQYQVLVQRCHSQQAKRRDIKKHQMYVKTLPKLVVQRLLKKRSLLVSNRLRHVIGAAKRCQCQLKTLLLKPDQGGNSKQDQLKVKLQGHYANLMCFVKNIGQSPLYCWFSDLNLKTDNAAGRLALSTVLEL